MVLDNGIYYDGYLHDNMILVREKVMKKDFDFMCIVDGFSGTGKSTLTMQLAYLVDPTFSIDRVCFRGEEFMNAVINAKKYQAIMLDEAYASLSSGDATTKMQKFLLKMLAEIRQKNLMIFFCCPSYFELNKNLAIFRSKLLIHVHVGKNMERGFFKLYTSKWKKIMYLLGRKTYDYTRGGHPSVGRFGKAVPPTIDDDAYRKKKEEALKFFTESEEDTMGVRARDHKWLKDRVIWILWQQNNKNGVQTVEFIKQYIPEFPYDEKYVSNLMTDLEKLREEKDYTPISRRKSSILAPLLAKNRLIGGASS
jgi:adenylate kinase family enzyme